jgi:general secretion pathway protein G
MTDSKPNRDQDGSIHGECDLWGGRVSAWGTNRQRLRSDPKARRNYGFTLIELMVVMSIIAILLSVAIPMYSRSIVAARERVLRSDLAFQRENIWKYTFDKQKGPQSLSDLKTAGYIKQIPKDPFTREENWEVVQEKVLLFPGQEEPGIIDVHSASTAIGTDGTAYNTW